MNYSIMLCSDVDNDSMSAEVSLEDDTFVLSITEQADGSLTIEIASPPDNQDFWEFDYYKFMEIIKKAKERLEK